MNQLVNAHRLWLLMLAGIPALGCMTTPTPLAPHVAGSVGVPHLGVQTEAEELPRSGTGFARYRPYGENHWGQPSLVRGLTQAAAEVSRQFPGSPPVLLGDLSAKTGGKIPRHNSHRSGRDVDLLFYVTTPSGVPTVSPGFIHIESDSIGAGNDGRFYRLDTPRQWALIKALLMSPHMNVQWMFCSRALEALMIDYALARGEDLELVWHAQTVLLQPGDSLPHDDHIHLRIACSPEDAVRGCDGGGPYWQWLPPLPELGPITEQMLEEIAAQDPLPDFEGVAAPRKVVPPEGQASKDTTTEQDG